MPDSASAPPDPTGSAAEIERRRVEAVRATNLVGVEAGERLDRIARRAARIAGTPMALVSLVDEHVQWSPGIHGADAPRELPREASFCSVMIERPGPLVVPDASQDPTFRENPLVVGDPGIRFYAGSPIDDGEGHALGAVCVIDPTPRDSEAGAALLVMLEDLAVWARHELLAGRTTAEERLAAVAADARLKELERLQALVVATTAHELRTPLTVLRVHAEMLATAEVDRSPEVRESLTAISAAVARVEVVTDELVAELRHHAGGAGPALQRWLDTQTDGAP